jgi:hypothetical protein
MKTIKGTQAENRNKAMKEYILNAIDSEGYDVTAETEKEKLQFLFDTFKKEYCYKENLAYYGSIQKTFENWLMGLPSCFNIDYENYRIIEIGKNWGFLSQDADEKEEDDFLGQWWSKIFETALSLARRNKVEINFYD